MPLKATPASIALELARDRDGARRAVALAAEEARARPAPLGGEPGLDEVGDELRIRIDAPGLLLLGLAEHAAVAGAGRVDEDEIGDVEQAERVLDHL